MLKLSGGGSNGNPQSMIQSKNKKLGVPRCKGVYSSQTVFLMQKDTAAIEPVTLVFIIIMLGKCKTSSFLHIKRKMLQQYLMHLLSKNNLDNIIYYDELSCDVFFIFAS